MRSVFRLACQHRVLRLIGVALSLRSLHQWCTGLRLRSVACRLASALCACGVRPGSAAFVLRAFACTACGALCVQVACLCRAGVRDQLALRPYLLVSGTVFSRLGFLCSACALGAAESKTLLEALAGSGLDVSEQALKSALKTAAAAEVAHQCLWLASGCIPALVQRGVVGPVRSHVYS